MALARRMDRGVARALLCSPAEVSLRPRENYRARGPGELGDIELIALLLGTGAAGRDVGQIAADLLHRFGGLPGVAKTEPRELEAVPGVGLARAVRLHAALEAGRRSWRRSMEASDLVRGPLDAVGWLGPSLQYAEYEEFHALYLDRLGRPLGHRALTRGCDAYTVVEPRQVFRPAVALLATALIVAHNHPSGDPTPSAADREVTRRLVRAGEVLGIRLLDHLIFAGETFRSMSDEGGLPHPAGWTAMAVEDVSLRTPTGGVAAAASGPGRRAGRRGSR